MRRWWIIGLGIAAAGLVVWRLAPLAKRAQHAPEFAGSGSCRSCHERFYHLWATSHHGLAMQPLTAELARRELTAPPRVIQIGDTRFSVSITDKGGSVREESQRGSTDYPMVHAMGGKNVYYFLTPMERGRLQVLPIAYDLRRKDWFDTAESGLRHFTDIQEQRLDWRDPLYTFNTSCHGCHVSQLSNNYDLKTDTYRTVWTEPGINCETCHGPSSEHVRVCREAPAGKVPSDLKIILTKTFKPEQHNSSCSSCHAKASVISRGYIPGQPFFNHFDLITLENPDYYADGRDLGENYTYTGWLMNRCAAKSGLHCVHCHTSSGRTRFAGPTANNACLPCHEKRVRNAAAHTHHKPDSAGNRCVSCHMPMTDFANMRRSDHSFRPPAPAATIAYRSPNACNICHKDRSAAWADREVRRWHKRDYQAGILGPASLVDAARRRDWKKLPETLAYISNPERDVVIAASLIRLLTGCPDERRWPVLKRALKDPHPLIRSAAAAGLEGDRTPDALIGLLAAIRDEFRVVRLRAAATLAGFPPEAIGEANRAAVDAAFGELEDSYRARPDDWAGHYNLGNYYSQRREPGKAVEAYGISSRLRPDVVLPLVNASIAYAGMGQSGPAEESLRKALKIEPGNASANFNLGLLRAEQGDLREAEILLRAALKTDPAMAPAAYNLSVVLARDRLEEAVAWCRKAAEADPADPKYGYTLAFYLNQGGRTAEAISRLQQVISRNPAYADAYALLASVYESRSEPAKARAVYRHALEAAGLSAQDRQAFEARMAALP